MAVRLNFHLPPFHSRFLNINLERLTAVERHRLDETRLHKITYLSNGKTYPEYCLVPLHHPHYLAAERKIRCGKVNKSVLVAHHCCLLILIGIETIHMCLLFLKHVIITVYLKRRSTNHVNDSISHVLAKYKFLLFFRFFYKNMINHRSFNRLDGGGLWASQNFP